MKVVQFKKTGNFTGNHDELTKALGGTVTYVGQHGKTETIKTKFGSRKDTYCNCIGS